MPSSTSTIRDALTHAAAVRPPVGGFPYLAETLRRAGVVRVDVTVPAGTTVYVLADAAVVHQEQYIEGRPFAAVAPFDEAAILAAVRADQAGDTSYTEFLGSIWSSGVVAYSIDTAARTCTYCGALGEQVVEHYADARLSTQPNRATNAASSRV